MVKKTAGASLSAIHLDKSAVASLNTQLYQALCELILQGALIPGERLPSSRVLANDLGVSRTTVIGVFDRLTAEGLIESRTGAGSFVSEVLKQRADATTLSREKVGETTIRPALSRRFSIQRSAIPTAINHSHAQAFSTAIPAVDTFPFQTWSRILVRHSRDPGLTRYSSSKGYPPLRRAIAAHLRSERGLECDPEQVFVTNGAHQAMLLLADMLIDPGDPVWLENPGPRLAQYSFVARGGSVIPVPVDNQGIDVKTALRMAPQFRLAVVTPSHQQPTGYIMSLQRRIDLLNAADNANAWVVEDDYDGEYFYARKPLPTLFSVASNQRVFYVGTFSKSMFPSLRIGYFVSPPHLVEELDHCVNSSLAGVPLTLQAALAEFIQTGHFSSHVRKAKKLYQERYQALASEIDHQLSDYLTLVPAETGFHAMTLLHKSQNEKTIVEKAAKRNILLRPLSNYCIAPIANSGLVLGYGCVNPQQIAHSITELKRVMKSI